MNKKVNFKAIYSKIYKFAKDGLEEMTTQERKSLDYFFLKLRFFKLFAATLFPVFAAHRCEQRFYFQRKKLGKTYSKCMCMFRLETILVAAEF